ncbi:MAG TPA: dTDP-4-dehydrorhamnose 3,5-epimerase family protein [Rhizomicrobium sp.]
MKFAPLSIQGAYSIVAEPHRDDRGAFARLYCPQEFAAAGIAFAPTQLNLSTNSRRHTLRGLHYRMSPFAEAKCVRTIQGRAFDAIVDLRPQSPTYRRWTSVVLDPQSLTAVFVPEGCAHGFLTLEDETTLLYQMGKNFATGYDRGVRWNDPAFAIAWPAAPAVISERDAGYPDFADDFPGQGINSQA